METPGASKNGKSCDAKHCKYEDADADTLPPMRDQPADAGPTRVMVVDDDDINHMVINRGLSKAGNYAITKFTSGESALDHLKTLEAESGYSKFPHVVLMDVNMPGISGVDAAAILQKEYPGASMPVIAVTGHSSASVRERALDAGCKDVLVKPVQSAELQHKVSAAAEDCRRRRR